MKNNERLRDERKRLQLLQKDVAALVGMSTRAQLMYESGQRVPDMGYLTKIAHAGFDVLYILTGQRSAVVGSEAPTLDDPDAIALQQKKALLRRQRESLAQIVAIRNKTSDKADRAALACVVRSMAAELGVPYQAEITDPS